MTDEQIDIDEMTDTEIDSILVRFDKTERSMQRRIVAHGVLSAALYNQSRAETKFQRETCDTLNRLAERLRKELAAKMDDVERYRDTLERIRLYSQTFFHAFSLRMSRDVLAGADPRKEGVERLILLNDWKPDVPS